LQLALWQPEDKFVNATKVRIMYHQNLKTNNLLLPAPKEKEIHLFLHKHEPSPQTQTNKKKKKKTFVLQIPYSSRKIY
jgi:hypothetical protein